MWSSTAGRSATARRSRPRNSAMTWAHATVHRGGHTLEMPPTRHRYWCIRQIAGDGRSETRGEASQGQIVNSSDNQGYRGPKTRVQRDERDPPRDVLSAASEQPTRAALILQPRIPYQEV